MKPIIAAMMTALVLSGCSRREADVPGPLAYPQGPWQRLGTAQWGSGVNDLIHPHPAASAATGLRR